ncbi:hypothetical protein P154DRAFT_574179 [Amniculicola lignicola CBS 123094]|uniref:Uncharacterized protein n=1 Tax=Amniculicola lignicola CBS 123094 TaxID=1392246 RepID=A0A6A5WL61_9PLEO|nr:hypothetical protein P154DRAFT_574179 [Amniculicola lignicola CBS 123094]
MPKTDRNRIIGSSGSSALSSANNTRFNTFKTALIELQGAIDQLPTAETGERTPDHDQHENALNVERDRLTMEYLEKCVDKFVLTKNPTIVHHYLMTQGRWTIAQAAIHRNLFNENKRAHHLEPGQRPVGGVNDGDGGHAKDEYRCRPGPSLKEVKWIFNCGPILCGQSCNRMVITDFEPIGWHLANGFYADAPAVGNPYQSDEALAKMDAYLHIKWFYDSQRWPMY